MWGWYLVLLTECRRLVQVILPRRRHVALVGNEQYWDGSLAEVFLKGKTFLRSEFNSRCIKNLNITVRGVCKILQ